MIFHPICSPPPPADSSDSEDEEEADDWANIACMAAAAGLGLGLGLAGVGDPPKVGVAPLSSDGGEHEKI